MGRDRGGHDGPGPAGRDRRGPGPVGVFSVGLAVLGQCLATKTRPGTPSPSPTPHGADGDSPSALDLEPALAIASVGAGPAEARAEAGWTKIGAAAGAGRERGGSAFFQFAFKVRLSRKLAEDGQRYTNSPIPPTIWLSVNATGITRSAGRGDGGEGPRRRGRPGRRGGARRSDRTAERESDRATERRKDRDRGDASEGAWPWRWERTVALSFRFSAAPCFRVTAPPWRGRGGRG